jgi:3-oxoacyl-[acyl-carrier protein] reductase
VELKDRVAIVTGSSMSIGEAIARNYARAGARVVLNARSRERLEQVTRSLQGEGHEAIAVVGDVSEKSTAERLTDAAVRHWNRLDILVNNAGTSRIGPSENLAEKDWRVTIDTDLTGPFFCSQAAARIMIPQHRGVILNISSILGKLGMPRRAAYCASKAGLIGLTKALATEWARHGIRVVSIDPAFIHTQAIVDYMESSGEYTEADLAHRTPLGRMGKVDEIAEVALFLASDRASYVTGSSLTVDGGWMAYGGW